MIARLRNLAGLVVALLLAYGSLYFGYRMLHVETWPVDDEQYVIFGSSASYYLFRPASHVDEALTGMHCHLGPHPMPRPTL